MTIITVSRGSGSGGLLLARGVAERLGFTVVSREDVVHEAARFGVPEGDLQEALLQPPRFWQRVQDQARRYLSYVQVALCERALHDRIVYHGNVGHFLLRGISHVLCLRLIAPLPKRIDLLLERTDIEPAMARQEIDSRDRQREKWTRFLYGVDWLDPNLYDLTINLQTMTIETAIDLVITTAQRPEFQTTPESSQALADLLLASRIRAALASGAKTGAADVEVMADHGQVRLRGRLHSRSEVEAVLETAGAVSGVKEVDREGLDAPDYMV